MMRKSIGTSGISDEALHAYFDGEATESEASAVRTAIEDDPELAAELEQLGVMQGLTQASLEMAAADVPDARFAQVWDQIDRAIDQGERLQQSANERVGLWGRILAALSPVKWPLVAAGAAAAVALLVANMPGDDDGASSPPIAERAPNKPAQAPSVPPADGAVPPTNPAVSDPVPDPSRLAQRPPTPSENADHGAPLAPLPDDNSAVLHEIDGAGNDVRISNSGTVTVLYVEEDAEEQPSERSL